MSSFDRDLYGPLDRGGAHVSHPCKLLDARGTDADSSRYGFHLELLHLGRNPRCAVFMRCHPTPIALRIRGALACKLHSAPFARAALAGASGPVLAVVAARSLPVLCRAQKKNPSARACAPLLQ